VGGASALLHLASGGSARGRQVGGDVPTTSHHSHSARGGRRGSGGSGGDKFQDAPSHQSGHGSDVGSGVGSGGLPVPPSGEVVAPEGPTSQVATSPAPLPRGSKTRRRPRASLF
jgi:hypothetical protein